MKSKLVLFILCAISFNSLAVEFQEPKPLVQANDVLVTWEASAKHEDGSKLLPSDIKTYIIGYGLIEGTGPAELIDIGVVNEYMLPNLPAGTYHFAVMAVDIYDTESIWSTMVEATIETLSRPNPPSGLNTSLSTAVVSTVNAVGDCLSNSSCVVEVAIKWDKQIEG